MAMTLSSLGIRIKTNSLYGKVYFAPKHVSRRSEKVKAINRQFTSAAQGCKGTKGIEGNRTAFQKCVGGKMGGAHA